MHSVKLEQHQEQACRCDLLLSPEVEMENFDYEVLYMPSQCVLGTNWESISILALELGPGQLCSMLRLYSLLNLLRLLVVFCHMRTSQGVPKAFDMFRVMAKVSPKLLRKND